MESASLAGGRRRYQQQQQQPQKHQKHPQQHYRLVEDDINPYTAHKYNNNNTTQSICKSFASSLPYLEFPPPPTPPTSGPSATVQYHPSAFIKNEQNVTSGYADNTENFERCLEPEASLPAMNSNKGAFYGGDSIQESGGNHWGDDDDDDYEDDDSCVDKHYNMLDQQKTWSRNNIAATMERFKPALTQSSYASSSYSYAYLESNKERKKYFDIPDIDSRNAGPSKPIPPNSMRALMQTTPRARNMYASKYGTQENIYEEITNDLRLRKLNGGQSLTSLNQSTVEEEFRRVESGHRRVLGELNLSIEAMLMPSTPNDSPDENISKQTCSENLKHLLSTVEPTDELLSPVSSSNVIGDMDSGFSGSSSGASYVDCVKYRTGSALSVFPTRSSTPNGPCNSSICSGSIRSSQRSSEDTNALMSLSSRSSSSYGSGNKLKSKDDSNLTKNTVENKPKLSFWIRKPWRKFAAFSSTTSIHKAGVENDEHKLNSGAWEDPLPLSNTTKVAHPIHTIGSRRSDPLGLFTTLNIHKTNINNNHLAPHHHNHTINSKNRRRLEHTPSAISSEDSWCSERAGSENDLSSEGEDESDRSVSSTNIRNSQFRSTLNKAKHHLSFDKWRNNNSNSSHSTNSATATLPSHHDTTSPGESPGGRLSRWFSIRRGSIHQYDLGGSGKDSRSSSIEIDDKPLSGSSTHTSKSSGNKMPQLSETEEDSNVFGLIGGRSNGSLLSLRGVCSRQITPALPPAPAGLSQQQLKRRHIVAAIVHSENSYVATLQRLVNDYKKPLEDSNPPILSCSKISTLFHRLPEILQCHTLFRIALADCVRNWDQDEKLGDVFVGSFSKPIVLDIYSGFINNFSAAMELAKMEAKRKSALADFFKVKQISAHDRLSFFGLMVKPVQRFPQFILFLQDLLKYTPQGHHDRMSLQLALTQLESLAEMLNERKREAEQYQAFKEMLGHISGTFNIRSLSSDGNRNRYLLREDNVTQMEFNQAGFIVKSKQRRLLLLNDKVICVSVAPKQSHDFGATEKLSFKWMYPVNDVEIVDNSASATLSRLLTAGLNRGGSLKSNSSNSGGGGSAGGESTIPNGVDNLCSEMSNLMHDYEVMSRINDLVGTLKGNYKDLNTDVTRNILSSIQSSIQKKDEEMAWVDSCCLQLVCRNKNGKEETFTFQTENPSVKKEWVTELRLAQLALDTNNSPAWEVPEHEQRPSTKMPLFVKAQPVYKSHHQNEVRCGCYYTTTNHNRTSTRRRSRNQNYLWICTSDGISSHITILSQHHQRSGELKDVSSFDLAETLVTSIEYVKGVGNGDMLADCLNPMEGDTVWMGTDSRKLLIYMATNPETEKQIGSCTVPSPVTQILYHLDNVFVSLSNGTIQIFKRGYDGIWQLKDPFTINLESQGSISNLLPINSNIYAGCGSKVWVINGLSGEILKPFEVQHVQHESNLAVNLMAHSGIGLWVSLKNSSIICLYHTETFKHLQDINIASNVLRVTSSQRGTVSNNSSVFVTALMACKGLLWVGTNVGISLTIPLPRLEGVPIISGGVNISYHAHFGPITFLLPLHPKTYCRPPVANIVPAEISAINSNDTEPKEPTEEESPKKERDEDSFNQVPRRKLEKQNSLDITAKLRTQLTNSPVVIRRRRFKDLGEAARQSKTLPRSLGSAAMFSTSIRSNTSSSQGSDQGCCDVYGLYGDLIFVKENFDSEQGTGNLMDPSYECLRRSDPELAAIPAKVSTLDRRLKMKVSRPRSLDLSNWSVDSRSSSLYTSSGSEESMGIRHGLYASRSVSRNSSNASHKTPGNGSDLMNISENGTCNDLSSSDTATPPNMDRNSPKPVAPPSQQSTVHVQSVLTATLKKRKNATKNGQNTSDNSGRRTLIMIMGGRGYINWRHIWYNSNEKSKSILATMPRAPNSNDAHIVIWEKKL